MAVSQKLTLKETSVDTLANTSKVKIVWTSMQTGDSHNDNTRTAKYWITINGTKKAYTVSYTLPLKTTKTILSTTITVPHRDDGTGTVKVQTWMDTRISAGEVELSKSLTLTAIAQASTIGATNAYIESTSIIGVNRKSEAYTHSVAFSFGDLVGYIDDAGNITDVEVKHTGTSIPFLITPEFYEYMTDKASETCQLVCRTYKGDTLIGSKKATFTIKADPELCRPVIICDVKDVNQKTIALTGDPDTLVRYVSTARCTVFAEALNSATITEMKVNGNVTGGSLDIATPETGNFTFSAEDSRGFVTEEPVTKNMIPYIPTTLNVKVTRTDPTSGKGILEASGQCYAKSFGEEENIVTVMYSINGSEEKVATVEIIEDGLQYTVSEEISGLDYMSTSTVSVTLSDALEEKSQTVTVKPGVPVFDWGEKDFTFHVPVSLQGEKICDIATPTEEMDAVNKKYVDSRTSTRILWVNENPSTGFAAQTINLDLTGVSGVFVYFKGTKGGSGYYDSGFIRVGKFAILQAVTTSGVVNNRGMSVRTDGITFNTGTNSGEENDNCIIPIEIYGLASDGATGFYGGEIYEITITEV